MLFFLIAFPVPLFPLSMFRTPTFFSVYLLLSLRICLILPLLRSFPFPLLLVHPPTSLTYSDYTYTYTHPSSISHPRNPFPPPPPFFPLCLPSLSSITHPLIAPSPSLLSFFSLTPSLSPLTSTLPGLNYQTPSSPRAR